MGMVQIGARGKTLEEIQRSLRFPDDGMLQEGFKKILSELLQEENEDFIVIKASNRLFLKEELELAESYTKAVTDNFLAGVEQVDFADSEAAATRINAWVEEMTVGKIKEIIRPEVIDEDTGLLLVNTIYFKCQWMDYIKFPLSATRKEDFFLSSSEIVKVDMMRKTQYVEYGEFTDMDAKAIALPYKSPFDGRDDLVMILIAPNKKDGVNQIEKHLMYYTTERITGEMKYNSYVSISLPRFKMTCAINCIPMLKKLGVSEIFDEDKADLTGITSDEEDKLFIDSILQKVFIEVNENKTEAAAATRVGKKAGCGGPMSTPPVVPFRADRPFVFQVVDRKHNLILFAGRCSNPLEEEAS